MRSRVSIVLALATLAMLPSTLPAQRDPVVLITGTVLGADGQPLKLAHVHLFRPRATRQVWRGPVSASGAFAIATSDTGAFYLEFTAVDHNPALAQLLVHAGDRLAVDARLKRYTYTDSLDKVVAIGDWNHFDFSSGTRPLVRQSDGRYTLEVETTADTLAYQLLHLETTSRSMNGTQADWYAYDNGGDYRSVIRVQNGRATIVFDPAALVRVSETPRITSRDSTRGPGRVAAELATWDRERNTWADSAMAARERHDSLRFDWAPIMARRTGALRREHDPMMRQLFLLESLDAATMGARIEPSLARRVLDEVPPSSPWWSMVGFSAANFVMRAYAIAAARASRGPGAGLDTAAMRATLAYLDRVLAESPDSGLKPDVLTSCVFYARSLHDDARFNEYFTRLINEYPNSSNAALVKTQFAPNRLLRVGARFPAFRFASLDDSSVAYSNESLAGKPYLIDFWATWCGPCIGEMRYLHAAHDSLGAAVEFLSVSMDQRAEDARAFRRGEWKMPWLHAFVSGVFSNTDMRRMEIMFLPRAILVGGDGTILAVDGDLRGESLLPTIRRALAQATPTP